jgi:hypothetical protein
MGADVSPDDFGQLSDRAGRRGHGLDRERFGLFMGNAFHGWELCCWARRLTGKGGGNLEEENGPRDFRVAGEGIGEIMRAEMNIPRCPYSRCSRYAFAYRSRRRVPGMEKTGVAGRTRPLKADNL